MTDNPDGRQSVHESLHSRGQVLRHLTDSHRWPADDGPGPFRKPDYGYIVETSEYLAIHRELHHLETLPLADDPRFSRGQPGGDRDANGFPFVIEGRLVSRAEWEKFWADRGRPFAPDAGAT